jgi:hypothetical protein
VGGEGKGNFLQKVWPEDHKGRDQMEVIGVDEMIHYNLSYKNSFSKM